MEMIIVICIQPKERERKRGKKRSEEGVPDYPFFFLFSSLSFVTITCRILRTKHHKFSCIINPKTHKQWMSDSKNGPIILFWLLFFGFFLPFHTFTLLAGIQCPKENSDKNCCQITKSGNIKFRYILKWHINWLIVMSLGLLLTLHGIYSLVYCFFLRSLNFSNGKLKELQFHRWYNS